MFICFNRCLILGALAFGELSSSFAEIVPLEFKDGDRVVLVGSTFIERAQSYGNLETLLTARWPNQEMTFRNLGWSGDTVFGDARSYFGPPEEGFQRLKALLEELKPTLILSCYGAVAAFDGERGLPSFTKGYQRLLDSMAERGARLALLSPPPLENLPAPLPNQDAQNARLVLYRDAIRKEAEARGCAFVDVFEVLGGGREANRANPLTDDGMHFRESGYATISPLLAKAMGAAPVPFKINVDTSAGSAKVEGGILEASAIGAHTFSIRCRPESLISTEVTLSVQGLAKGTYILKRDNEPLLTADQEAFQRGVRVSAPKAAKERFEKLRQTINKKNALFFHRWRPQNETYLFGFRKHEQGQNAVEIAQFDPLIAAQEEAIGDLREPIPFEISLTLSAPEA